MSTGHFIDDRLGGETWLPTPRDEDREYERARQDEVDVREVATCCADCGRSGVNLYSTAFGPWQCWDCRHPKR